MHCQAEITQQGASVSGHNTYTSPNDSPGCEQRGRDGRSFYHNAVKYQLVKGNRILAAEVGVIYLESRLLARNEVFQGAHRI